MALGYAAGGVFEAAVIGVGIISLLSVVTLAQDSGGATGGEAASVLTTGNALVAIRSWTGQPAPTPTSAEAIKAPGRRALRRAANLVTADAVL